MSPDSVNSPKPDRLEVIRRTDHIDFEHQMHAEENTWAVSYADLLMVLLSFFVIFFSVESSKNKDALIYKILSEVKNPRAGTGPANGYGQAAQGAKGSRLFTEADAKQMASLFKGLNPAVGRNPASLTLEFPDNVYKSGTYKLKGDSLKEFHRVFEMLRPYDMQLEVMIIGHSDSKQVAAAPAGGRKFEDNFELSSLRASAAIREAVTQGFSEDHIRGQAASHNERNTRSISIMIRDINN